MQVKKRQICHLFSPDGYYTEGAYYQRYAIWPFVVFKDDEVTEVRKLSGWAEVAIIAGIVVWTLGVGYFLTTLDIGTDLFGGNQTLETWVCYLDACASAVGICNGLFILFRIREQWIAWYICALLEATINILSGQYVLLVLKVGYLTNTTYGYIKWTKYIREHKKELEAKKQLSL